MKKFKVILGILCVISIVTAFSYRNNRNAARDVTAPVITSKEDVIKVKINASDEELLAGLVATDDVDGDISDNIIIEKIQKDEEGSEDEFKITYVCFDSSENVGRLTKKLVYKDYKKPHFQMTSDLRFPVNTAISLLDYIKAEDSLDGDISPFITLDGTKNISNVSVPGRYSFNLSVTNSVGDTSSLPIEVEIYEESYEEQTYKPSIVLKEYIVYVDRKKEFRPEVYIDYIEDSGRYEIDLDNTTTGVSNTADTDRKEVKKIPLEKIEMKSSVNEKKAGVYSVVYKYTSEETGYEGKTKLIVVVE